MERKFSRIEKLVLTAVFGGLCFLGTFLLAIPYAGGAGFFCFGDAVSLFATFLFGPIVGLGTALIGSLFSDLALGYSAFIPFTILSKSLLVLGAFGVKYLLRNKKEWGLLGFFVGGILMPLGYLPAYLIFYGEFAWAALGFDYIQGIGCAILACALYFPIKRAIWPKSKER